MQQLVFATHNHHKFEEVKKVFPQHINLLSLTDINFHDEIEETEATIEANALLKAKTIFLKTGLNCFADDSGLCIDALNGAPGVYSARYAGEPRNDEANIDKVLQELQDTANRTAYFKTVMALVINGNYVSFEGIINGIITLERRGSGGFGYDAVFMPDNYKQTFAEIPLAEKTTISHRAIALQEMLLFLKDK